MSMNVPSMDQLRAIENPTHQSDVEWSQEAPVQNTWYTILETTNAPIIVWAVRVRDTAETLEVRMTIDGNVLIGNFTPTADLWCRAGLSVGPLFAVDGLEATEGFYHTATETSLEGRSVKLEIRKTTANGAGALESTVRYGRWSNASMCMEHQPDAFLDQEEPEQNKWYPILSAENVRIYTVGVRVLTTDETLECQMTIDGILRPCPIPVALVAGTWSHVSLTSTYPNRTGIIPGSWMMICQKTFMDCKSILVEVRKTTAAGAGNLQGCVKYAKR